MTRTMNAAVLFGARDVRIEQREVSLPRPGEVLVRIECALTCGTDVKVFNRGYHARMIQPPALFGHEFAGVIEELGSGVAGFQRGDRVVAANSAPCDKCFYCNRAQHELCEDLLFMNGAYAQFITVPARIVRKNLLHIPDDLSMQEAALLEPLACVVKGLEDTGVRTGETVAVLGAGPIGLMFIALARSRGARVICAGRRKERLKIAREIGADEVVDAEISENIIEDVLNLTEDRRGADRVIEAVGQPFSWEAAIAMTRPGGTVNLFGGCSANSKVELDTTKMHYGELTLKASFHHTPRHTREALAVLAQKLIPAERLISGERPLAQIPELLGGEIGRNGYIKVAINPWS